MRKLLVESTEEKKPLLTAFAHQKQQIPRQTDEKLNSLPLATHTRDIEPLNLGNMPPVAIHTIMEQLYNQAEKDGKVLPSKEVAKLKAASRHFYGRTPVGLCLFNTRKQTKKFIEVATCYWGLELLNVEKKPDYRPPHEVDRCQDYGVAGFMCVCCLPISIPAGIFGALCGCALDTQNAVNGVKIKHNRPLQPKYGYLSIPLTRSKLSENSSKAPPRLSM